MNIAKTLRSAGRTIAKQAKRYMPQILMGVSVAGVVTTTVLAVKGTVKAVEAVEEEKEAQGVEKLPVKDVVRVSWKYYIPTGISMATTVASGIGSCVSSLKRTAALATAYQIAETAREEYMEATKEVVGDRKAEEISAKASEKRMERDIENSPEYAEFTRFGNTLFRDDITGRYFRSTREAVEKARNDFNKDLLDYDFLDLNSFYYKLEIESDTEVGRYIGLNVQRGLLDIYFDNGFHPVTGEPCTTIKYASMPYYMFDRLTY